MECCHRKARSMSMICVKDHVCGKKRLKRDREQDACLPMRQSVLAVLYFYDQLFDVFVRDT
jgi:hypothetical protein